ncbi:MAG: type II secretion system minor pseudopilin GspK [Betaproteobacteria bacterium]
MNTIFPARSRESGLALIVAMLVAALAAAVAVSLARAQTQWAAEVAQRADGVQAQSIALAGVQWTRQIIGTGRAATYTHLGQPWALPLPPTPVDNGVVEGRIADAQGLLNVNNLANPAAASFERLRASRLFASLNLPPALLAAVIDWVDADAIEEPGGAEDDWYRSLSPPGIAPNMPAARIQELADVRGMTARELASLMRFATALPEPSPLNVNTAPPELLAASVDGVATDALNALITSRTARPFATIAEFRERLPPQATLVGNEAMYTVKSRYFLVLVRARQGDAVAHARALIDSNGAGWPRVVWQTVE